MSASPGSCSGRRHVRHRRLMAQAGLVAVERHRHGEDRLAVLDRDHAAGGEALAVADAVDVVDDRHLGIAGEQEIGVQRMRRPAAHVDGAAGGDQRLADHLPAEHALPADLRRAAAEQVHLELLEIEDGEQVLDGGGHSRSFCHNRRYAAKRSSRMARLTTLSLDPHAPPEPVRPIAGGQSCYDHRRGHTGRRCRRMRSVSMC